MKLSIVVPVLDEEENILPLTKKVEVVMNKMKIPYELIFIDDGSTDNTAKKVEEEHKRNKNIKLISFLRNYGKASALTAGFSKANGDVIVTMDGDLQDDPGEIPLFLNKIKEGYDFVNGWKTNKHKDYAFASFIFSKMFNIVSRLSLGIKIHDLNCPFKAYKREAVKNLKLYGEMHRYIPVLMKNNGFRIGEVKVKNYKRKFGKPKYGKIRLLKGFLDLVSIKFLTTFKKSPLYLFGTTGFITFFLGFLGGFHLTLKKFILHVAIGKEPLLLLSTLLMILGVQLISLGLIGELMINLESKRSEPYEIKRKIE